MTDDEDASSNTQDDDQTPVSAFLKKDGAVEITATIGNSGASFTQIKQKVSVSHVTVNKRLKIGANLGLWDAEAEPGQGEQRKVYRLSTAGQQILEQIEESSYLETLHQIRPLRDELQEKEEEVVEWTEQEETKILNDWEITVDDRDRTIYEISNPDIDRTSRTIGGASAPKQSKSTDAAGEEQSTDADSDEPKNSTDSEDNHATSEDSSG